MERIVRKFSNLPGNSIYRLLKTMFPPHSLLHLDPDRFEQIMTNLIDNAIRHTPEQGQVVISLHEGKEFMHIAVQDSGSGIPEEDLPLFLNGFTKQIKQEPEVSQGLALAFPL